MILELLLVAAAPAPAMPVRLDCLVTTDPESGEDAAAAEPAPLKLSFEQRGRRIGSVVVDGPPLFSSFENFRSYVGTGRADGSVAISESRPLATGAPWKARVRDGAIVLSRGPTTLSLSPGAGSSGAYSGRWSMRALMHGHVLLSSSGNLSCTRSSAQAAG